MCYIATVLYWFCVILLLRYIATVLYGYCVILLLCYIATVLFCYCVILLPCYIATVLYCYCVILLQCYIATVLYCYSAVTCIYLMTVVDFGNLICLNLLRNSPLVQFCTSVILHNFVLLNYIYFVFLHFTVYCSLVNNVMWLVAHLSKYSLGRTGDTKHVQRVAVSVV